MALDLGIFLEGSESTFKVKVSSNDTQPDYLINKFTSSDGSVTITETNDGGIEQINLTTSGGGGISSPLTTKGDLYTYDSADARLGVGADGQALIADSGEATGLRWGTVSADNFATADLTLTGNRTHTLGTNTLLLEGNAGGLKYMELNTGNIEFTTDNSVGKHFSINTDSIYVSSSKIGLNYTSSSGDAYTTIGSKGGGKVFTVKNSSNADLFWIDNTASTNGVYVASKLHIGDATASHQLSVKGTGSTSATTTLLVENSSGTDAFKITDDTKVQVSSGLFGVTPISAATASGLTASDGDIVYVNTTDATFTSIGFWGYENGAWVKL